MSAHKDNKRVPHHLSRDASAADGWVESLTSLTEAVEATQLLDEGNSGQVGDWAKELADFPCFHRRAE